ncbi:MAG TPA: hypothetical protein DCM57_01175, partial [Treponema sp.]|nr:hypothetical protein [Treponema sp.]
MKIKNYTEYSGNTQRNGIHLGAFFAPAKNRAFRGSGLRLHSGPCPTARNAPRPYNPFPDTTLVKKGDA